MKHFCLYSLFLISGIVYTFYGCNTTEELYHSITVDNLKSEMDTLSYTKLPSNSKSFILSMDEENATIISQRKFNLKKLIQIHTLTESNELEITSYSAKPITNINLYLHVPEINQDVLIATLDSLPALGQIKFVPSFTYREMNYPVANDKYLHLNKRNLDLDMLFRLDSDCEHYKMLQKIKTDWNINFSNFDWAPNKPTGNWLELTPLIAREWIVVITNLGYMLSSPQFEEVMLNFYTIFGGHLCHNNREPFSESDYKNLMERYFNTRSFNLGRVTGVNGLGGGNTFGAASFCFYGHYASYSGWSTFAHELSHCYGFGHDSNMTYPYGNVGWEVLIANLHVYMTQKGNMPYESREILGMHREEYAPYRDFNIDASKMNDNSTLTFYNNSVVRRYFEDNN
ncbi:MAG: hypothetical protein ACRDDZ_10410 [Marinifilaceae bacterium]